MAPRRTRTGSFDRRLENADHRIGDFRPDAVAGKQGNCVRSLPLFLLGDLSLGGLGCFPGVEEAFQLFLELAYVFEVAVNAGEANVGDLSMVLRWFMISSPIWLVVRSRSGESTR